MTRPIRDTDVLVIGAGAVGVSTAYALASRGQRVAVIDSGRIGEGSSYGNAGLIVPSHSVPIAAPGVISAGLRWLFDAESPFYVRPRLDPGIWIWLLRFALASREHRARLGTHILARLLLASRRLYDTWAALHDMPDCSYDRQGLIYAFRTPTGLDNFQHELDLLSGSDIQVQMLDGTELREVVPTFRIDMAGGALFPDDAHINPHLFVLGLATQAKIAGADFHESVEALGFETTGDRILVVHTTAGPIRVNQVVLAAGAWSPALVRELRLKLPIQAGKGYSLTYRRPDRDLTLPLVLGEARLAITPMGPLLRLAGTMELAGMDLTINRRRVRAIQRAANEHFRGVQDLELVELWRGLRPCSPDGLPLIGYSHRWKNLIIATGHTQIGLSLGPITGEIVATIANGDDPPFDLTPLRPDRFGRFA